MNYKKLLRWKVGHSLWTVKVDDRRMKKSSKAECDINSKTILLRRESLESADAFLEDLFHELLHALDENLSITYQIELGRKLSKNSDHTHEHYDMVNDLRAVRLLALLADNVENFRKILDHFGKRRKR